MSKVTIQGDASGTGIFTIASPNSNTDRTLVLPDEAGTVLTTAGVPASAMPAGSVIQAVSAQSGRTVINTTTPTTIVSTNITTSANSKIFVTFAADCNALQAGAWKRQGVYIDGVIYAYNISSTADNDYQSGTPLVYLSAPLSAGTHSVEIKSWNGLYASDYAQEGTIDLVVMEIAG